MINPLIPYGIKGVIWYQGESNAEAAYQYRSLFPLMIKDWRKRWGQGAFPFLFVQLANWKETSAEPGEDSWAELREAQAMTIELPNTGMAVAIDIGDAYDIHPKNKQEVGRRLGLQALYIAYGKDVKHSGPVLESMQKTKHGFVLTFSQVYDGLTTYDGNEVRGFAIAGEDRKFVWARADVIEDNKILVWNPDIPQPVAVRYAWSVNPDVNLMNSEGLPAAPFRTDDWAGITQKK
jgi:sialate O-acetylesterase